MTTITDREVDPRITRTRRVVLEAVLAELADAGSADFTVESVAARAGVGKSTIYRHWSGRRELIADALETLNVQPEPEPGGAARESVEVLLTHLVEAMRHPLVGGSVPALIEAAERDATIADLYRGYAATRRRSLRAAVARGVADGSFPRHLDPELAAQALAGAVFYRRLLSAEPMRADEVSDLVTTVLGPG